MVLKEISSSRSTWVDSCTRLLNWGTGTAIGIVPTPNPGEDKGHRGTLTFLLTPPVSKQLFSFWM